MSAGSRGRLKNSFDYLFVVSFYFLCPIMVTRVSALGGVQTLSLFHCRGITDVSALGGVHTLSVSHCRGITDVRA